MRQLIDEAREAFDWIIVDTPPVVLLPDANLLALDGRRGGAGGEGGIHTVRCWSTRAVDAIGRDRVLGVVLNSAQRHQRLGLRLLRRLLRRRSGARI